VKARPHRKRPGRKPKSAPAPSRRLRCRDCRFRAPSGACLDPVLTSGRCGDYVRYVFNSKQRRRLYVEPANPRTVRQQRWRDRFGAASKNYSESLTDEQRDACIAAGAKLRSRQRLGQLGPLTGQQNSIRMEYAANAKSRKRRTARTKEVRQLQKVAKKYLLQVLQPQRLARPTPGTRRGVSGILPDHHHRHTGRDSRNERTRKNQERRRHSEQPRVEVIHSRRDTRLPREHYQTARRAGRHQIGLTSRAFPLPARSSFPAGRHISRLSPNRNSRRRSPDLRSSLAP
jgi:hypothetical protein